MSLLTKVGTLVSPASTGQVTYSVPGFGGTPKCVLFWSGVTTSDSITATAILGFGVACSTSSRAYVAMQTRNAVTTSEADRRHDNAKAIGWIDETPSVREAADLASFGNDEFTLNWTTIDAAAYRYHYLVLGGDDLEANLVEFTTPTSTGTDTVAHGLTGGSPNGLIVFGVNDSSASPATAIHSIMNVGMSDTSTDINVNVLSEDNDTSSDTARLQDSNIINLLGLTDGNPVLQSTTATVSDVDSTNVTLNYSAASSARRCWMLALRGVQFKVNTFNTPTTLTNQSVNTVGFEPSAVLLSSFMGPSATGVQNNARIMIGADDGTHVGAVCAGAVDEDGQATTDADRVQNSTKSIQIIDHEQATKCQGRLSMRSKGFEVYYDSVDATTSYEIGYLAIGKPEPEKLGRTDTSIWM